MDARAHFATLARYNQWATERLLQATSELPDADYRRDVGLFFHSIHGTLNHLLVAEHGLWFARFSEGTSPRVPLDEVLESSRAGLRERLRLGGMRWLALIMAWPSDRFSGTLDYTTLRGTRVSLPFAVALAHVFNHGTHHRGQMTAALTAMGRPCPELDLIYMLQEEQATS